MQYGKDNRPLLRKGMPQLVSAAVTNMPQVECLLTQDTFISHSPGGWEVHDQAGSRGSPAYKFADGHLLSVSSQGGKQGEVNKTSFCLF